MNELQKSSPDQTFMMQRGAVYAVCGGKGYGIYSLNLMGKVVRVAHEGKTFIPVIDVDPRASGSSGGPRPESACLP